MIEERDTQRPFYLQVSFNAPHFPLAAPPEYLAKYRHLRSSAAVRAAIIDALDNAVGRILETLDERGLRRNTLVVFLSDNGADQTGRNAPFRSGKGSVYEGGIHVPCLLRWPRELEAGSVSQQPISAQDLYPTLAAAAGVMVSDDLKLDGKNLWPAIREGVIQDRGPFLISAANSALFDGDWKLIESADGRTSLFQIANDPGETTDVIVEQAAVAQRLQATLSRFKQDFPALLTRPRPGRPAGGPR